MINKIFLLSDLGLHDYYVVAMKNTILKINPSIKFIIDITHEVSPWNIVEGSFILWQTVRELSEAIVIGVVDPGVGGSRRDIVIECNEYVYLVGPDNGLFYPGAIEKGIKKVWVIDINNRKYFPTISPTFYGRDVYAKAGGYLSLGDKGFLIETSSHNLISVDLFDIKMDKNSIEGRVLHIDRFGNIISNIKCGMIKNIHKLGILINNKKIPIKKVSYFTQLKSGELGLICGSSGLYEIVSNLASASKILNIRAGDKILFVIER